MKTIQERRLDFINSEFYPYIDNPKLRAVDDNSICFYLDPETGNQCIIGKQIPKDKCSPDIEGCSLTTNDLVFSLLPKDVRELGRTFLVTLQKLHDLNCYWDDNKFNELGQDRLEEIKKEYCTIVV